MFFKKKGENRHIGPSACGLQRNAADRSLASAREVMAGVPGDPSDPTQVGWVRT